MTSSPSPPYPVADRVVSDAGPLISLEKLTEGFPFIRRLYDRILVPTAVLKEVGFHEAQPEDYLERHGITDLVEVHTVASRAELPEMEHLHAGEIDAIRLALALELPLLIEETVGRRAARKAGVPFSGIAGQILKGYRRELLTRTDARAMLEELLEHRRINERIFEGLVASLREG